jgi:hypothetical protein
MTTTAPTRPAQRRALRRFVPPQHGAWAMLLLPYLAGLITAGFRRPDLPLLGAWLSGYLLSYYLLQALKTRRIHRFRAPIALYAPLTVAFAAPVVAARPQVLLFAPAYAVLIAVNGYHAWRRRERDLLNDLASVVQSCLMVFAVATIAEVPPSRVAAAFTVVLLYLTGTVLYVKTMIRERGNDTYRRASIAYHTLALGAAALLGPLPAVLFAFLLARAWLLPRHHLKPKHVGMVEIAASILVLAGAALAG